MGIPVPVFPESDSDERLDYSRAYHLALVRAQLAGLPSFFSIHQSRAHNWRRRLMYIPEGTITQAHAVHRLRQAEELYIQDLEGRLQTQDEEERTLQGAAQAEYVNELRREYFTQLALGELQELMRDMEIHPNSELGARGRELLEELIINLPGPDNNLVSAQHPNTANAHFLFGQPDSDGLLSVAERRDTPLITITDPSGYTETADDTDIDMESDDDSDADYVVPPNSPVSSASASDVESSEDDDADDEMDLDD